MSALQKGYLGHDFIKMPICKSLFFSILQKQKNAN